MATSTDEIPEKIRDYAERYMLATLKRAEAYGMEDVAEFFADEIHEDSDEAYDAVLAQIREAIDRAEVEIIFPYEAS